MTTDRADFLALAILSKLWDSSSEDLTSTDSETLHDVADGFLDHVDLFIGWGCSDAVILTALDSATRVKDMAIAAA